MKNLFLKFLGKIYRYTGIYLGKYWENKYIEDNYLKFHKDWKKYYSKSKKSEKMNFSCYLSICRGSWQADYGFCRPWRFK